MGVGREARRNANDLFRMDGVPTSKAFVVRSGPHGLRIWQGGGQDRGKDTGM